VHSTPTYGHHGPNAARRVRGLADTRAAHPLLPLRLVLDRNRGGAYLAVLLIGAAQ
jgi:hypothetical protein